MKNSQKGFIIPLLIVIVGLLMLGGEAYVYTKIKPKSKVVQDVVVATSSTSVALDENISTTTASTSNQIQATTSVHVTAKVAAQVTPVTPKTPVSTKLSTNTSVVDCGTITKEQAQKLDPFSDPVGIDSNVVMRCVGNSILNGCVPTKATGQIDGSTEEVKQISGKCYLKTTVNKKYTQCSLNTILQSKEWISSVKDFGQVVQAAPSLKKEMNQNPGLYGFFLFLTVSIQGQIIPGSSGDLGCTRG